MSSTDLPAEQETATESPSIAVPSTGKTLHVSFIDERKRALVAGTYALHQQDRIVTGSFVEEKGTIAADGIDPAQPFMVEVSDRVCAIYDRAFIDPDDPSIEYGGTWFDWTAIRDRRNTASRFWRSYRTAMDNIATVETAPWAHRAVDRFWQHEHLVRRPIRAVPGAGTANTPIIIRAVPTQVRTGPIVRYTDATSTSVWIETVTPSMIKLRLRRTAGGSEQTNFTPTVRVGGRHFGIAEMSGLSEDTLYEYTLDIVPLPAGVDIPVDFEDFKKFPELTDAVESSMRRQLQPASVDGSRWLQVRTLRRKYDRLRFITGSCRWYPGDVIGSGPNHPGKDWGPDMLDKLGEWLRSTPPASRPHFQFYGGDQIYADEIGDNHAKEIVRGRFASRIPGPADAGRPVADRLVDGAWAGRFAHRLIPLKDRSQEFQRQAILNLRKLDALKAEHGDLQRIVDHTLTEGQLRKTYRTVFNRRDNSGQRGEAGDERRYRRALEALPALQALLVTAEPFRQYPQYWSAGRQLAARNPDMAKYRSCNFLLWSIPDAEGDLPTLQDQTGGDIGLRGRGNRGHPSVDSGRHVADFAEYAFLYERAWTTTSNVRTLLGTLPTFLMFDDHEVTDDWNFDGRWVRMLHSKRDYYRMWPKTITDALCAYWMYQGLGNRPPSAWKGDPRGDILLNAQRTGKDALGPLRELIHSAVLQEPPTDPRAPIQAGLALDWHYQLPIEPPFIVPDCRSRKWLDPFDDKLRVIDHVRQPPRSETIDAAQIAWIGRSIAASRSPVVFIAPSTPLLLQNAVTTLMVRPESAARAAIDGVDVAGLVAAVTGSAALGFGSDELLRTFRRRKDLEHMVRDKSWRDVWGLIDKLPQHNGLVRTVVLVSGDVHHSYCMTGTTPGRAIGPDVLQITTSGLQTTIRSGAKEWVADKIRASEFSVGSHRLALHPLVSKAGGAADVLYWNTAAIVETDLVRASTQVAFLTGSSRTRLRVYRFSNVTRPSKIAADEVSRVSQGSNTSESSITSRQEPMRSDAVDQINVPPEELARLSAPLDWRHDREGEALTGMTEEEDDVTGEDEWYETEWEEIEREDSAEYEFLTPRDADNRIGDDEATQEIILVAGANYPKFKQVGSLWQRVRTLSPGPWRQFCLTLAQERLAADPGLVVTLFDFLLGTRETVTLGQRREAIATVEQKFAPPVPDDYWNLTGVDWSHPTAAAFLTAEIEPANRSSLAAKAQVSYFDGATVVSNGRRMRLLTYLEAATKKVTSPVMSMTDVYAYIEGFAAAGKVGRLREFHVLGHAFNVAKDGYSGGPILLNSLDHPGMAGRHPLDKDARALKDFRSPTMNPAVFAQAFGANARSFIWGCNFQRGFIRQFVNQIGRNRQTLAAGRSMKISFSPDWGDVSEFRNRLGLSATGAVRNVNVDQAQVERVLRETNQATYMQKLATASRRPAVGSPPGTYADYDSRRSASQLMHIPMSKDPFRETDVSFERALTYFRDHLNYRFDTSFGNHNGLGRGYMIYEP